MIVNFAKMVASGNDFVVIDNQSNQLPVTSNQIQEFVREICQRKKSIGADGLLLLEESPVADIKMRIFNPDGTEPETCGNGARCVAVYIRDHRPQTTDQIKIETKAGLLQAQVKGNSVKIRLTNPKDLKINIPIKINNRVLQLNFINTGLPHAVLLVRDLEKIDVPFIGRLIRINKKFLPGGTNVDFVQVLDGSSIKIRTYERGVEDETLACGTGAVASSLVSRYLHCLTSDSVKVFTKSGEALRVYYKLNEKKFNNVWLEGKVNLVYKGEYYV